MMACTEIGRDHLSSEAVLLFSFFRFTMSNGFGIIIAVLPERGWVASGTRSGHSPGTDRDRQATHEGRHPNPSSDGN